MLNFLEKYDRAKKLRLIADKLRKQAKQARARSDNHFYVQTVGGLAGAGTTLIAGSNPAGIVVLTIIAGLMSKLNSDTARDKDNAANQFDEMADELENQAREEERQFEREMEKEFERQIKDTRDQGRMGETDLETGRDYGNVA